MSENPAPGLPEVRHSPQKPDNRYQRPHRDPNCWWRGRVRTYLDSIGDLPDSDHTTDNARCQTIVTLSLGAM